MTVVDLEEYAGLDYNTAGETIYLEYRSAKRKWRKFSGGFCRRRKGKGKGSKGKNKGSGKGLFSQSPSFQPFGSSGIGKGKGHGKRTYFGAEYDAEPYAEETWFADAAEEWNYFSKGKGGGKGGGNVIGKDGKRMLCSVPGCNSPDHFRAHCPKGKGKGPSSSFFAQPAAAAAASDDPTTAHRTVYFSDELALTKRSSALAVATQPKVSYLTFSDGSTISLPAASPNAVGFYPWWELQETNETCYHSRVRISDTEEGLVIDTGAVRSLAGDAWVGRVEQAGKAHNRGSVHKPIPNFKIEGVGTGTNTVTTESTVPIALPNGTIGTFASHVVNQSNIPALLGLTSLEQQRAVIDLINHRLILVGEGGYKLDLSPGSQVLPLCKSETGHLMLPVSRWHETKQPSSSSRAKSDIVL